MRLLSMSPVTDPPPTPTKIGQGKDERLHVTWSIFPQVDCQNVTFSHDLHKMQPLATVMICSIAMVT